MKTTMAKWATKAAGAGAVALLLATPAVAQSRGDWNRNQDQRGSYQDQRDNRYQDQRDNRGNFDNRDNRVNRDNRESRNDGRINASGRIRSFSRERDGYRIRLDNDSRSYWVPESSFGRHARDLRVGISIGLGGVFRDGSIYVDAVNWPGDGYGYAPAYDGGFLRGVVERVDYRDATLRIRDDRDGRIILADLGGDRYGREELRRLRRGDFVELSGQWLRGGVFGVDRLERR